MINRLFHGTLGRLVGLGYLAGAVCLVLAIALSAMPSNSAVQAQDQGNCLEAGEGQVRDKHDDGGTHTFTAPSGWIYVEAGFKAGDSCFTTTSDGNITVNGEACYNVSGLGTNSVTITQLKESETCKEISHTEAIREQEPTPTPVPPTNTPEPTATPTDTPEDPTATPTETPITPTNTPVTPTNTPTDTPIPTATNTLEPGVTPSATPEPSATPTATLGPPLLIDPKVDSLLTDNDGNGVPSPGDVLLYTVTITNAGETAAEGVTFSDSPDPNTSLVVGSVTTTQGTVTSGNTTGDTTIGVDIGTIEPDETVTVTFEVTIDAGLSPTVLEVENQGLVTGDNFDDSPTDDPDTDDPDDPTVTQIVHQTATPTQEDPGEPKPTSTPSDTTVLIPVTGVDRTVVHTDFDLPGILQNFGLSLLGVSLVIHGISFSRRRDD